MNPAQCKSARDVQGLNESIFQIGDLNFLIQHDGAVIVTDHPHGMKCKAMIEISRPRFHKFMDWYQKEQT